MTPQTTALVTCLVQHVRVVAQRAVDHEQRHRRRQGCRQRRLSPHWHLQQSGYARLQARKHTVGKKQCLANCIAQQGLPGCNRVIKRVAAKGWLADKFRGRAGLHLAHKERRCDCERRPDGEQAA